MITIALQSPWPTSAPRVEKAAESAHALPPVATVQALPDSAAQGLMPDHSLMRERDRENFRFQKGVNEAVQAKDNAPQPFPELRFADPLPNLPELDLPAKTNAWHLALMTLRVDDHT